MPNQNKQEGWEEGIRDNIARIIFRCGYVSLENDAEREKLRNYIEPLFNFIEQTIHQEREKAVKEEMKKYTMIWDINYGSESKGEFCVQLWRYDGNGEKTLLQQVTPNSDSEGSFNLLPTNNTKEE